MKYPFINNNLKINKPINYKNRGLLFESMINDSNNYYLYNNIALIYKRTTPIKIINTDPSNKLISKAVFEKDSTTDYNGVYKGRYIDFEAKETISKTSFPLSNIKDHQLLHLGKVIDNGGIAFFLIYFTSLDEIYLIRAIDILNLIKEKNIKSLSLNLIRNIGFKIRKTTNILVDYLQNIEKIFNF